MRVLMKLRVDQINSLRADLRRNHAFAYERVAFLTCRFGRLSDGGLIILAHNYYPVADENYIDDPSYGALISGDAFRAAFQLCLKDSVGIFHVHFHAHSGIPTPSRIDRRETAAFVPDFFNVMPTTPHGAIILSNDALSGQVWLSRTSDPVPVSEFKLVGPSLQSIVPER